MTARQSPSVLEQEFSGTLDEIIAAQPFQSHSLRVAIGFSGGLDSSVLLTLASLFAKSRSISLFAFHIHHGLSPNADAWLKHCQFQSDQLEIGFDFAKVSVEKGNGQGVEASARTARYIALGALSQKHQIDILLLAHHLDDQAETILLQMLRGSGIAGIGGMERCHVAPSLLGTSQTLIARPLLGFSKTQLQTYAIEKSISYVEDESNADQQYARNALRHSLMPVLQKLAPGFEGRLARTAQHARSADSLLKELAQKDFDSLSIEGGLDIDQMQLMSNDRVNNLLRFWLAQAGVKMPSTARLHEIRQQVFVAREDAKVTISHDGIAIHRFKNRLYAERIAPNVDHSQRSTMIQWSGQPSIHLPMFHGTLYFEPADEGLPKDWLRQQALEVHLRRGGERIKIAKNRSTREMKKHYQSLEIPFWERDKLPFISVNQKLLFAAGVGTESSFCEEHSNVIQLRWEFDRL